MIHATVKLDLKSAISECLKNIEYMIENSEELEALTDDAKLELSNIVSQGLDEQFEDIEVTLSGEVE